MEDKKITCKDCGKEFIFTVGEQEFTKKKDLKTIQFVVLNVEKQESSKWTEIRNTRQKAALRLLFLLFI